VQADQELQELLLNQKAVGSPDHHNSQLGVLCRSSARNGSNSGDSVHLSVSGRSMSEDLPSGGVHCCCYGCAMRV